MSLLFSFTDSIFRHRMPGKNLTKITNLDLMASYTSHEHVLEEVLIERKSSTNLPTATT